MAASNIPLLVQKQQIKHSDQLSAYYSDGHTD
jgi:hypothetical protein